MSNFEIRRPAAGRRISIVVPFAASRGLFLMRDTSSTTHPPVAAKAEGTALGCLTRDVVAGGPSVLNRAQVYPGRLELEFAVDGECSLDPLPDAVEVEGSDYILTSGTGELTSATALNTKLSFVDGKFREKQSTDEALYLLADKPTAETSGNLRILAERIHAS